ncbi:hypothetical protein [Crocinitomix algicola]|uniref:hypothetical protein n=1 Tax=Crocinitomix algicola TaxID=1740263 RepID=UPI000835E1DD|nr:hypothetical protein [Crocinitomix algicola]
MNKEEIKAPETPYTDVVTFLKNKQFELANMGVSYKNAYDWRTSGLYLQDKQRKYRMKYSPIEYIWLLLVKEIREFGLSFDAIKNVKSFLMMPVDVSALLLTMKEKDSHPEIIDAKPEDLGIMKGSKEEIERTVEKLGEHIVDSIFTSMLVSTLLKENTYYLRITKEGNCTFESDDDLLLPVINESYLTIPLANLVKDFLEKEQIDAYNLEEEEEEDKITQEFELDDILNRKPSAQLQKEIDQLLKELEANHIQYTSRDGKKINIGYDSEEA